MDSVEQAIKEMEQSAEKCIDCGGPIDDGGSMLEMIIPGDPNDPDTVAILEGYGVTSFDPEDVTEEEDGTGTVGGGTALFLTKADVTRLRTLLSKLPA